MDDPRVIAALVLLLSGMTPTVLAMLHHEVRATWAAKAPGPVRDGLPARAHALVGAALAFDAVLGASGLVLLYGAQASLQGLGFLGAVAAAAYYGARLLPYALGSLQQVQDPTAHALAAVRGLPHRAEALELEILRHRARYQPDVARTTLVARAGDERLPLLWAEKPAKDGAGPVDPRVRAAAEAVAAELHLPLRVVEAGAPLAPGLGPRG